LKGCAFAVSLCNNAGQVIANCLPDEDAPHEIWSGTQAQDAADFVAWCAEAVMAISNSATTDEDRDTIIAGLQAMDVVVAAVDTVADEVVSHRGVFEVQSVLFSLVCVCVPSRSLSPLQLLVSLATANDSDVDLLRAVVNSAGTLASVNDAVLRHVCTHKGVEMALGVLESHCGKGHSLEEGSWPEEAALRVDAQKYLTVLAGCEDSHAMLGQQRVADAILRRLEHHMVCWYCFHQPFGPGSHVS
jgi:hypothetical protein